MKKNEEFLEFNKRLTKKRKGEAGSSPRAFNPKIGTGNNRCLLQLYKKFASKRPRKMMNSESDFYLSPRTKVNFSTNVWYVATPMGKNSLQKSVSNMAKDCGFVGKYTNHSLRKTTCQDLLSEGVASTEICQLTGHNSVNSLNNYAVADVQQKKHTSDFLIKVKKNI